MSVPGSTRIVDVKLRSLMESAVTAKEFLEKEGLELAKIKKNLSASTKFKALAWEQMAVYELAHRTHTAEETKLNKSLNEKTALISSLRKTYADKKEAAVGHILSNIEDNPEEFETAYTNRAAWFDFLIKNSDHWDEEAFYNKDAEDRAKINNLIGMLKDPDDQDSEYPAVFS